MTEFKCFGPYPLATTKKPSGARIIDKDEFWSAPKDLNTLQDMCGVYVFAIKPPRTTLFTPCYVGQAKASFGKEALHNDKILKYQNALSDYKKGKPYLFFLAHPRTKLNKTQICQLEDYLIMMGFAVNPNTQNDKKAKLPLWKISGIVRSKTKKASKAAKAIAGMFQIKSRKGV